MTNELGIIIENNRPVVSSRKVAEAFEKPHADVLKAIRSLGCDPYFAEGNFSLGSYKDAQNQERPEYLMTRIGFSVLTMGFTGAKALKWKIKYAEAFEKMEEQLRFGFHTLAESEDMFLSRAVLVAQNKIERLEAKIESDAPKVELAERLEASPGTILIGDLAKELKKNGLDIGRDRLFALLHSNGENFLMKSGENRHVPTQKALELGVLESHTRVIDFGNGTGRIAVTPRVTGKGVAYFIRRYCQTGKTA